MVQNLRLEELCFTNEETALAPEVITQRSDLLVKAAQLWDYKAKWLLLSLKTNLEANLAEAVALPTAFDEFLSQPLCRLFLLPYK